MLHARSETTYSLWVTLLVGSAHVKNVPQLSSCMVPSMHEVLSHVETKDLGVSGQLGRRILIFAFNGESRRLSYCNRCGALVYYSNNGYN